MHAPYYCRIVYQCGLCSTLVSVVFLTISILIFDFYTSFFHPFMDMFAVFDLYIFMVKLTCGFGLCRFTSSSKL